MKRTILVTGGAGYIGSHTVVELLCSGYSVIIVDNLSNANVRVLDRIKQICGTQPDFFKIDLLDRQALTNIFFKYHIDAVIHFAALKAVGESVSNPLLYYDNNINATLSLIRIMEKFSVRNLIFSSSATVYGNPASNPISEDFPLSATNPYGYTKLICEQILVDIHASNKSWSIGILRYFNPVGAHKSGLIGENPHGTPNNLMPYISQVAVGKLEYLNVFGNDYLTPDGTGIRDYIHVVDLALGHISALNYIFANNQLLRVNLGSGRGYSVLEVIKAFAKVSKKIINYNIKPRRAGDVAQCFADATLAKKYLSWSTKYDLYDMCEDSWHWQCNNPDGY